MLIENLFSDPILLLLVFLSGLFAGFVNVYAGGGTILTIAVLVFHGIPVSIANGTNTEQAGDDKTTLRTSSVPNPLSVPKNTLSSEQSPDAGKPPDETGDDPPKKTFTADSDEMKLAMLLFDRMRVNNPDCKEPNFQVWCKHIDWMMRLDKRKPKDIQSVIVFSQKDPFWQSNILSTEKLREKYDQLVLKMKERGGANNRQPANKTYTNSDFLGGGDTS